MNKRKSVDTLMNRALFRAMNGPPTHMLTCDEMLAELKSLAVKVLAGSGNENPEVRIQQVAFEAYYYLVSTGFFTEAQARLVVIDLVCHLDLPRRSMLAWIDASFADGEHAARIECRVDKDKLVQAI